MWLNYKSALPFNEYLLFYFEKYMPGTTFAGYSILQIVNKPGRKKHVFVTEVNIVITTWNGCILIQIK